MVSPKMSDCQVSSAPQTASLTPSAPCLSSQMPGSLDLRPRIHLRLSPFTDENWLGKLPGASPFQRHSMRQSQRPPQTLFRPEAEMPRTETEPNMFPSSFAGGLLPGSSQPCSVVVPAFSSKWRPEGLPTPNRSSFEAPPRSSMYTS